MRKTISRRGVTIRDLGSCETRNGIAWAAEVGFGGKLFFVENCGDGGMTLWSRVEKDAGHRFAGVRDAQTAIAALARTEPALAEYADCLDEDAEAAGMFISAALDGCFLVVQA